MKSYLIALAIGVLVGVIYGVLRVRSPAPPVVALVGLFGMLAGEQLVPIVRSLLAGDTAFSRGTSTSIAASPAPDQQVLATRLIPDAPPAK